MIKLCLTIMRDETGMFTHLRLENFKSWRELDIDLAPVTILFGTNSSGKSSILQSILFLVQSSGSRLQVDFGGKASSYVDLGSYEKTVFRHDVDKDIFISLDLMWETPINIKNMGFNLKYENDDTIVVDQGYDESQNSIDTLMSFGAETHYFDTFQYLGPIRQRPKRTYLWDGVSPNLIAPDGENTIAALVESDRRDGLLSKNVSKWLNEMELVSEFRVSPLDEGKRFYETLVNIIGLETALLDTGFGISQVLPVITMLFFAPEGSIILLEQPELHLHPRA